MSISAAVRLRHLPADPVVLGLIVGWAGVAWCAQVFALAASPAPALALALVSRAPTLGALALGLAGVAVHLVLGLPVLGAVAEAGTAVVAALVAARIATPRPQGVRLERARDGLALIGAAMAAGLTLGLLTWACGDGAAAGARMERALVAGWEHACSLLAVVPLVEAWRGRDSASSVQAHGLERAVAVSVAVAGGAAVYLGLRAGGRVGPELLVALSPVAWVVIRGARLDLGLVLAAVGGFGVHGALATGDAIGALVLTGVLLAGVLTSHLAIAEARAAAALLARHRDGLEARVVARTAELEAANERLAREARRRRQVMTSLQEAAAVFDNADEGVAVTDAEGRVLRTNPAFDQLRGAGAGDRGCRMADLVLPGPGGGPALAPVLRRGETWRGEVRLKRRGGRERAVWLSLTRVAPKGGAATRAVWLFTDLAEIKANHERLDHLAHHDALTALPNRAAFERHLGELLARRVDAARPLSLMCLDLDRFKHINDTLGHPVGDQVLVMLAARLRKRLRREDLLCRVGGDEFTVTFDGIAAQDVLEMLAAKVLEAFAEPFEVDGVPLYLSASVGIARFPEDGRDVAALIRSGDSAMYKAKERGPGEVCFYTAELTRNARERLTLGNALRRALAAEAIAVHYQPQVPLEAGGAFGVEALARWTTGPDGPVSPAIFVPLVEELGLAEVLGAQVLRRACEDARRWLDAGVALGTVAVNISAAHLAAGDSLASLIEETLRDTGVPPEVLEIELTEGVLQAASQPTARACLDRIRALGVRIAIDDFGTGWSSLSRLHRLPIDRLKIDRSFVAKLPDDTNACAIAAAVVALGSALELEIVAEGVETAAQRDHLARLGCEAGQGWLWSPAVPADAVPAALDAALGFRSEAASAQPSAASSAERTALPSA